MRSDQLHVRLARRTILTGAADAARSVQISGNAGESDARGCEYTGGPEALSVTRPQRGRFRGIGQTRTTRIAREYGGVSQHFLVMPASVARCIAA